MEPPAREPHRCIECRLFDSSPKQLGIGLLGKNGTGNQPCRTLGISAMDYVCVTFLAKANRQEVSS